MPNDETDLIATAKQRAAEPRGDAGPRPSAVAFKLMQQLVRGGQTFSKEEIRVAGDLIQAGAEQLGDGDNDERAIWNDFAKDDATKAQAADTERAKPTMGRNNGRRREVA